MKKKLLASSLIFIAAQVIADPVTLPPPVCTSCTDDPVAYRAAVTKYKNSCAAPAGLSSYLAYCLPGSCMSRISSDFWWVPRGLYFTGMLGYSILTVRGIENVSDGGPDNPVPATVKSDASENKFTPGVAIGYQWADCGLDRIEVAFMPIRNIAYNSDPFLVGIPSTINSDIDIYPVLFKIYWDFDYGWRLIPYLQAGAGVSLNHTESDSTITIPFLTFLQGSSSNTQGNFAWDVGIGTRFVITPTLLLNFGYEFDSFGFARWRISYPEETPPIFTTPIQVKLESNNIYSNTFMVGLTWRPFYCRPDEDAGS